MPTYFIHSVVRSRHNRTARAALPANPRMKQHIGADQQRLIRGKPLELTEEKLREHLEDIRAKAAAHVLEVRTADGRLVDLTTLEAAPGPASPLLPHPKLDSVNDDKPVGQYIPPYVGDDGTLPQVLPPGERPSLLKEAAEAQALDAVVPADDTAAVEEAIDSLGEEEVPGDSPDSTTGAPPAAPQSEAVHSKSKGHKAPKSRR